MSAGARDGAGGRRADLPREMVGVELLLVAQRFEVGFDDEIDYGRRVVGEVLLQRLRVDRGSHGSGRGRSSCKGDRVVRHE
jgi:hypothetical protein